MTVGTITSLHPITAPTPFDWQAIGEPTASSGFHLYIIDANGRKIGVVWGKAHEKAGTAALLAAAPQMQAALELFVSQWNACGPNSDFGRYFQNLCHDAVAALTASRNVAVDAPPLAPDAGEGEV